MHRQLIIGVGLPFVTGIFRQALRVHNIDDKEAAIGFGMDPSQFSRQINGKDSPAFLGKLERMPIKVVQTFFWLGLIEVGLPGMARRTAAIYLAVRGRKRMARLELAAEKAERVS
jgi:hypothetical protein